MPPPHVITVPKSKEKGIRVRRSSMEKTIFCVLIVIVIWRGIAVSGLFSSDSSSMMMMGRQNENDDFDIGSGGGFKRSNDED